MHRFKNASESQNILPLFSTEEAAIINKAVLSLHSDHPQKTVLLNKLRILAEPGHLVELITDAKTSRMVSLLMEAIRHRKRVILHHYHSPSSDTVLDRITDPIGFSINMKYLYAFDPEHQKVVQFKPERIGRV
jgi:proteasome accessory factor C